jgi:stage II sporulation protein D
MPVTWTANAVNGIAPYRFQFWVYDGAQWRLGRDWSPSSTWTWTPSAPGTYSFQVWVRNAGSTARFDAFRPFGPYVATGPPALSVSSLSADRAAPVPAGTPVTWTAVASGGTGPYTYQFWVFNGTTWNVGQDWSASPTWTWIPSAPVTYMFQVWVRNAESTASFDAYRSAGPYTVGSPAALAVTRFVADRAFPVPQGSPVTWTASAVGGAGPYTYQFWVFNGTTWSIGRAWNASPTWMWIPPAPATYTFQVWVRSAGSAASFDAYRSAGPVTIGIAAPLAVTSLTVRPMGSLMTNAPAVVTATATGGTGPYTYQFWVFDGATWSIGQPWSASNTFTWTPSAAGTYSMQVWVRNVGSAARWDAWGSMGSIKVVP